MCLCRAVTKGHGLSPATTSTTPATLIGNKRKIEPIQSALNRKKKKKQRNRNELSHAGQKQIDDVQQLHSVQLTATAANVSFNFAKKGL